MLREEDVLQGWVEELGGGEMRRCFQRYAHVPAAAEGDTQQAEGEGVLTLRGLRLCHLHLLGYAPLSTELRLRWGEGGVSWAQFVEEMGPRVRAMRHEELMGQLFRAFDVEGACCGR